MEELLERKKLDFLRSLAQKPASYDFQYAVRRIELLNNSCERVGILNSSTPTPLTFGQIPHLYFPPSELSSVKKSPKGNVMMQVYFFGFYGPQGALPLSYTEYVHTRGRNFYDLAMQRFLDIFQNRLIALFYRAMCVYSPTHSRDKADDPIGAKFEAIAGKTNTYEEQESPWPNHLDIDQLQYAQLGTKGLEAALKRFYNQNFSVENFVPKKFNIDPTQRFCLGSQNTTLGNDVIIGLSRTSITEKVRIHVGPVDGDFLKNFAPESASWVHLTHIINQFLPRPMSWELCVCVRASTLSPASLNGEYALGFNAAVHSPQPQETYHRYTLVSS